jgi:DNA-binding XRE family transcriptional regulator
MNKQQTTAELELGGKTYVILPKADYLRLCGLPPGTVEAIPFARASIGRALRAAREHAGLTQETLAAKMRKSQTMIARSESGQLSVGEKYVAAVLKACRLPKDWKPSKAARGRRSEG